MKKKDWGYVAFAVSASLMILFVLECMSTTPHYVLEKATVRKVIDDPDWGYIGTDFRTLVKFDDGFTTHVSGDRGDPGERILVHRQYGTKSLFGIMGKKEK